MRCKQIEKQTGGAVTEIELEGLICNLAHMCRRKGICVLSPYSYPGHAKDGQAEAEQGAGPAAAAGSYYEVLRFKNSLGFQWIRAESFSEAIQAAEKFGQKG
ncbi:MAG: hypothetical protein V1794_08770, partial [Candidatus Glassbacteria bacterium]